MPDRKLQLAENVLEFFVLSALVIAPLFTNPYSALPFEEAKVLLLRSIAILSLPFLVFVLLNEKGRKNEQSESGSVWHSGLAVAVLIIAYALVVSTVFSVFPSGSFLGMYLRRQGTYTSLCYLYFFFVILNTTHTRRQIDRLIFTMLLTSFTVAVWAILQRLGIDPHVRIAPFSDRRVWSTLGNPIFLSAFLIMTTPLHFYFFGESFKRLRQYRRQGISLKNTGTEQVFFGLMLLFLVLNLTAIGFAQSRGPIVGLMVGLVLFAALELLRRGRARIVSAFFFGGGVFLGLLLLVNLLDQPFAEVSLVSQWFGPESAFQSGTGLVRATIWKGVCGLIASDPIRLLTGYGPETLSLVYPRHNPPILQYIEKPTAIVDRAHNEILDLLATQGVLGLAAFVFFFFLLSRFVLRQLGFIRSTKQDIAFYGLLSLGGILGVLILYLVSGNVTFFALGLGLGLIFGLFSYLFYFSLAMTRKPFCSLHPNGLLLCILLAGLVGHFVEIQLSFSITATKLYFWAFAALTIAAGKSADVSCSVPASLTGQKSAFSPSMVIPAFLAGLVISTVTFDYLCFSKTKPGILSAVFACHLCIFFICALFSTAQLKSETSLSSDRFRGLAVYGVLALSLSGVYLLSYSLLEGKVAQLLHPLIENSIFPALERNTKLASYYGWILAFVAVSSFLRFFGRGSSKEVGAALKAVWILPLFILLAAPIFVASNFKNSMADMYTKTGESMMAARNWGAANLCFSKAISLDPSQAWRHQKLGYLYFTWAKEASEPERSLSFQRAIFQVQKATHLSPLDATLKNNLARMSSAWAADATDGKTRFHRLQVTDTFYMEAFKTDPNNSFLWKESAQIATALGKSDEAVQRFQRALQLHPDDFKVHRKLAFLLRSLKRYPEALVHAEQALRLAEEEDIGEIEGLVSELKNKTP